MAMQLGATPDGKSNLTTDLLLPLSADIAQIFRGAGLPPAAQQGQGLGQGRSVGGPGAPYRPQHQVGKQCTRRAGTQASTRHETGKETCPGRRINTTAHAKFLPARFPTFPKTFPLNRGDSAGRAGHVGGRPTCHREQRRPSPRRIPNAAPAGQPARPIDGG